ALPGIDLLYSLQMDSFFSAGFFAKNRGSLRTALGGGAPIIITANGQMQRSGDSPFTFVQDSNFWYLTGLDDPDLVLVMLPGETFVMGRVWSGENGGLAGRYGWGRKRRGRGIREMGGEGEGGGGGGEGRAPNRLGATWPPPPASGPPRRLHPPPYRRRLIAKL